MRRITALRGGFTLVELLVGMGLIILLSALAVGVAYSGILDSHKLTAAPTASTAGCSRPAARRPATSRRSGCGSSSTPPG